MPDPILRKYFEVTKRDDSTVPCRCSEIPIVLRNVPVDQMPVCLAAHYPENQCQLL